MKLFQGICFFLAAGAPALPCNFDSLKTKVAKEQKVTSGTVKLGTLQTTPKDQDPVVAYFENGKQVFCRQDYDTTGVDARPVAASADTGHLYVAFSVNGGSGGANSFTRFTTRGWIKSYGQGKGAKVLLVLKLVKTSGEPVAGTYIIAQKEDGKTNAVALISLNYSDGKLSVVADAWHAPLTVGGTPFSCSGKSPFRYYLDLQSDLSSARGAAADNCKFKP